MTEIDEAIELSEYQATWPRAFAEEQGRICQALDIPRDDLPIERRELKTKI